MRLLGPLRRRDFALLWAGSLVSLLGDGIYLVAIAFAVLELSDSPAALSIVGVAWATGQIAFLLWGGVLADRHDKRLVLIAADLVRLLALAAVGVLALTGHLELWHLVALAAGYGIGEGLAGPAMSSIVPELVPEHVLLQANALQMMLRPLAFRFLGPALGGAVFAVLGTGGAFLVDAGTFAASMGCLLLMRGTGVGGSDLALELEPLRDQVRIAVRFVRRETWLWATLVAAAISILSFMGPVEVLVPYLVDGELGGGPEAFGFVLAANGAGQVLGTLGMGQRGTPRREITFLYWTWGVGTFAICGYALAEAVWQLMAMSFAFGLLLGAGGPIWGMLLQTRVPAHLRGRVASLDWLVSFALMPVSFALTGPAEHLVGVDATLLLAGGVGGLTTLLLLYAVPGLRAEDGGLERAQRARSAAMSSVNAG